MSVTELAEATPVGSAEAPEGQKLAGRSPTQIALARLRKDKVAVVCSAIVVLLVLGAVLAPVISKILHIFPTTATIPYQPYNMLSFYADQLPIHGPPNHGFWAAHPLGIAPGTAVDNLSALLYGLRTDLLIATTATVVSTVIGVVLGLMAGFSRGWLDRIIMFVTDLFLSFPFLLGALAMAPILTERFGQGANSSGRLAHAQLIALMLILSFFYWMPLTRLIRGQVLSLREREFVQAALVMGVPTRRILFKELLPNLVAPIVVATSLTLPGLITAEAGLSYLGIGVTETPSLGQIIFLAQNYWQTYPLYLWAPVLTICVLVVTLNLVGDSIRDAFDPRTRR
ncbi:MAG TPA: ABC transporter permease [Nocardioides sp.]|jgi:peptide/nickel transport system permease protein|uniref:ABC transporter permease n=1 Tax=Nocardioides sp. TaxID=35761 RepID=UPI002E33C6BA|nr:ABC transporter permease [Nocardioides sp.]HEX3932761.1 ABC transporter permease [Nocardioides sp.]